MMACVKYQGLCRHFILHSGVLRTIPVAHAGTLKTLHRSFSSEEKESFYGSLTRNFKLMTQEFVTKLKSPNIDTMFDRSRVLWEYKGPESLKEFKVVTDATIGGQSTAKLGISRNNKLLFTGNLNTDVPKDGETVRSGFCTLKTLQQFGSFNRKVEIDLTPFTTLHLRLRGDGRAYMINMYCNSYFTLTHDDVWSYFLFTRGGPHWQNVSIPFSKFFLSSQGRVQDKQSPVDLERVTSIGLTMADAINGEFSLELGSIHVTYDATESEEFVYERYQT
ncbi:putative complex I intermediate-associated protein 30, mitochondrial [Apostichopus japonicus]|uniref:Putative complex I intermediate-associated protein 30, mitochondrial n=1 Tax=Stichopus japonicus TaxID=307972 RepID=A0A2G8K541_STIJA|nr:putative complex I intermediate-associated protein 30, mitochondrial [Apostichopus japonicus]